MDHRIGWGFITAHNSSCRKVMFSRVCQSAHGGGGWGWRWMSISGTRSLPRGWVESLVTCPFQGEWISLVPCPFRGNGYQVPSMPDPGSLLGGYPPSPWYRHLVVTSKAGGTHPTGMLSCVHKSYCYATITVNHGLQCTITNRWIETLPQNAGCSEKKILLYLQLLHRVLKIPRGHTMSPLGPLLAPLLRI